MDLKKFNRRLILTLVIILFITALFTWRDIYPLSLLGLAIFFHQLIIFTVKLGKQIPTRELIGILSGIQLLVTPFLDYHIFPNLSVYGMSIEESSYMNFVVPANLLFIIGLHSIKWKNKIDYKKIFSGIKSSSKRNPSIGYALIILALIADASFRFAPDNLRFIMVLTSQLKYIGALYLIFSEVKLNKFWFYVILGSLLFSSILRGMFIDLFIWGILLLVLVSYKYKLNFVKNATLLFSIFLFAFTIQAVKTNYRAAIWHYDVGNPISLFYEMTSDVVTNPSLLTEREIIDYQITRLNQGWIVAKIMNQVPTVVPYANGETVMNAIVASIFPRVLMPFKAGAGDQDLFAIYTGHLLTRSTAMNLGLVGEAYANFGVWFGIIFVGLFGLFLNYVIYKVESLSEEFPTLILWLPFLLTYPIRPGNDIAVILNHLVKALFVTALFFYFFRKKLKLVRRIA